ncbi:glycosyltransferase family 9 protein [uncultured Flavobacterium sp.]|uniref:glycosyltransferase family 9 protein n=1 Tax=uncultured Flavobacterium sp. TaxID=165435 RepID=UPI0030EB88C4|tara:strand:- start:447 stop:1505 length:1059 start_codon:yes stop_codon:yes gene_type:complete
MKIIKEINVFRRKVTKLLTNSIGNSHRNYSDIKFIDDLSKIKRILIIRPNHRLGNTLLYTPMIQEVIEIFPNATIDLFVKGEVAKVVFQNYGPIKNYIILPKKHFKKLHQYLYRWFVLIFKRYDLTINIEAKSSSGKIATELSNAKYKFYGTEFDSIIKFKAKQKHFAKLPVYRFRNFIYTSQEKINENPIKELNLHLSESEIKEGSEKLNSIVSYKEKQTISIFTFATGNKCYSEDWWNEFYSKLLVQFPNYNIVEILPFENVSQINFKAPTYYSKDIREIAAFISNTAFFIGADSGMMHLACATKTPVIGLFAVTPIEKYGPFGKNKTGINTDKTSIDQIIKQIKKTLDK